MAMHGIFQQQVGEDSIATTVLDVSSEDEPSRRSPCLLAAPAVAASFDDSVLQMPPADPSSFSSALGLGPDEDANSCARPPRLPHMLKDEEDLPLSMLFADFPSTPRCAATGSDGSSDDVVEVPPTTPRKARPRKATPEETATPEKTSRPKASPSQAIASTPQKAVTPQKTLEAWFSPKGSPKQRRRSPEPRAKAKQKRKTLAQSLKDRQKARTTYDKEAKAAARAEARKAKVAETEQLLADTIRSDRNLYEKLLCFELMEIEELAERIRSANDQLRSVGRKRIRDFLEAQGFVVTQQRKIPKEVFQKGYR